MDCGNCSNCGQFCDFPDCLPPYKRKQYEDEKKDKQATPVLAIDVLIEELKK